jgi:hypothetical protein
MALRAFQRYMAAEDSHVTRAMFEQNLHEKLTDPRFTADIDEQTLMANKAVIEQGDEAAFPRADGAGLRQSIGGARHVGRSRRNALHFQQDHPTRSPGLE